MPGLVPGIYAVERCKSPPRFASAPAWMAGTGPAMTAHNREQRDESHFASPVVTSYAFAIDGVS
jgi:hypothetical protein